MRTLNNLSLLSQAADATDAAVLKLPDASAGHSPTPGTSSSSMANAACRSAMQTGGSLGNGCFPSVPNQEVLVHVLRKMQGR